MFQANFENTKFSRITIIQKLDLNTFKLGEVCLNRSGCCLETLSNDFTKGHK